MQILVEIKEKLEELELEMFRKSCFGHFLDLDANWTEGGKLAKRKTFAGQLVYCFMLRRMQTMKKQAFMVLGGGKTSKVFTMGIHHCHRSHMHLEVQPFLGNETEVEDSYLEQVLQWCHLDKGRRYSK